MNNTEIREVGIRDLPAVYELRSSVLGETREMTDDFFRLLPDMGTVLCLEEEGMVRGQISVLTGCEFIQAGKLRKPVCGCICQLAVREDERKSDIRLQLLEAAEAKAFEREASILFASCEELSVTPDFREQAGLTHPISRSMREVAVSDQEMTMKLSSTEYAMMRDGFLTGKNHFHPSFFTMEYLRLRCESLGGGLFASMSGICMCKKHGAVCELSEVISENPAATAASVAFSLGCEKAVYALPDPDGAPFLYADSAIPSDTVWNISF